MSPGLSKVVERAKREPEARFSSLAHHLDEAALKRAFARIRKDAAAGVDGTTKEEYAKHLDENIRDLHQRLRTQKYRHQPIRRVHIPKGPGSRETRPIGISTIEDKIVQGALREVLEAIYEQDFLLCSFGFRPGRSAHDALGVLDRMLVRERIQWVLEADIRSFFDSIDRKKLMELLQLRVADGSLLRLVGKCLHVGVLDGEVFTKPEGGTAQGSIISPLLGNVYLHHVLDLWFEREVHPRLRGHAQLIRYADDFVIGFTRKEDAERVLVELGERMAAFGLTLHPDKTRIIPFARPARTDKGSGAYTPVTFDFLGFSLHWRRSRGGSWIPGMKTRKASIRKTLLRVGEWCRRHRHRPRAEQHAALSRKLNGHYEYFGVNGNYRCLSRVLHRARRLWFKWLQRRGQRKPLRWKRFNAYLAQFPLPAPRIRKRIWAR
jgi:group II intron reverse transcriptase/maturase